MNSSPGPDGFGPSFYKNFWPALREDVLHLFKCFFDGTLDLDGLNRAHLVLLSYQKKTVHAQQTPTARSLSRIAR